MAVWSHGISRLLKSCVHSVADHHFCSSCKCQLWSSHREVQLISSCHILQRHKHPINPCLMRKGQNENWDTECFTYGLMQKLKASHLRTLTWSSFFSDLTTVCLEAAFHWCCRKKKANFLSSLHTHLYRTQLCWLDPQVWSPAWSMSWPHKTHTSHWAVLQWYISQYILCCSSPMLRCSMLYNRGEISEKVVRRWVFCQLNFTTYRRRQHSFE